MNCALFYILLVILELSITWIAVVYSQSRSNQFLCWNVEISKKTIFKMYFICRSIVDNILRNYHIAFVTISKCHRSDKSIICALLVLLHARLVWLVIGQANVNVFRMGEASACTARLNGECKHQRQQASSERRTAKCKQSYIYLL